MKQLRDSKEMAVNNEANLESLGADVALLETVEKLSPQNTANIAILTAQVNSLADLKQRIANVTSTNKTNIQMINTIGKHIQQMAIRRAIPDGKTSPLPKGTGSVWPPPGGLPHR